MENIYAEVTADIRYKNSGWGYDTRGLLAACPMSSKGGFTIRNVVMVVDETDESCAYGFVSLGTEYAAMGDVSLSTVENIYVYTTGDGELNLRGEAGWHSLLFNYDVYTNEDEFVEVVNAAVANGTLPAILAVDNK